MTARVAISAIVQLTLMLGVVAAYLMMARRSRLLWHPVSIVVAVATVSIVVAVAGELIFRGGVAGVPAMVGRSAIGGLGWGVVIAAGAWVCRRAFAWWASNP